MVLSSPKLLALLAAVAIAVAHPLCAHSLVLCVGSDGHVELEPSIDGSCTDARASESAHATVPTSTIDHGDEEHCGECVDLPMVHAAADVYSAVYSVRVMAPSAITVTPIAAHSSDFVTGRTLLPRAAESAADLASLRSVSLRI